MGHPLLFCSAAFDFQLGAGSGLGTILSTYLIGWAADHYSFQPVLVAASAVPLAATLIVCLLVPTGGPETKPNAKSN